MVELSIVLVILGLLTGGILAGQSLIRAAELRSVVTDSQRYITAFASFKDKYFAIPGDMPNAVKFWGAQAGVTTDGRDATCAALTTSSTTTATCNGDGNGNIGDFIYSDNAYEPYRGWQHLANAGLIEGRYAGVAITDIWSPTPGVNSPTSKLSNAVWRLRYFGGTSGFGVYWPSGDYGNVIEIMDNGGPTLLKPE